MTRKLLATLMQMYRITALIMTRKLLATLMQMYRITALISVQFSLNDKWIFFKGNLTTILSSAVY